ncbi:Crp/Fnr family transcriptional regulator [Nocardia otitidiscaviarum]|uniref:Crp/Fnr family transcriptional regulator n=1 Tax=Nocardia otitidiscaviarum TaxID=1823 RepID=A0A516NP14_9NOCA|nr:Crp/Fnr family transcriptional regulator [Nocardia otitidiscaviarum]MCP9624131.1 Crp/Fnr family transcriptional regulator [Nocardia otitidiscaviarum]QDP80627.1 Crp/Fnr family transcriptional regulator [Nocardia otitidiscaviarum]
MSRLERPFTQLVRAVGGEAYSDDQLRQAAWIARCVGRGESAPLGADDLTALADFLELRIAPPGTVLFTAGRPSDGVWVIRHGRVELSVGSGRRRAIVDVLRPGDVDGDIPLLLDMPLMYTARALTDTTCLFLSQAAFEKLLAARPAITRRWLSSVAQRTSAAQNRLLSILGRPLPTQVAQLLLDESVDGKVPLAQRTLAAMIGVQRPSLNKVLKDFERDGLIGTGYAAIEIRNPDRLRAIQRRS